MGGHDTVTDPPKGTSGDASLGRDELLARTAMVGKVPSSITDTTYCFAACLIQLAQTHGGFDACRREDYPNDAQLRRDIRFGAFASPASLGTLP